MNISIFGLGYVGSVSAGCLTKLGHTVIGVDVSAPKTELMAAGKPPVHEEGLSILLEEALKAGMLSATDNVTHAIEQSKIAMICVGTPSTPSGGIESMYLENVISQIGFEIKNQNPDYFCVMIRSTCPPRVHRKLMSLLEETSGKKLGQDIGYVCHPEFLREGIAVDDFFNPPKIVFGPSDDKAIDLCKELYPGINAETFFVATEVASMVKYADNCFHALKVTFANEIGMACKQMGVDSREVMSIFAQDRKLNISPKYLRPGLAFGGSCLPKDLRAILDLSRETANPLPMLAGTLHSNQTQIDILAKRILSPERPVVGLIGLAFKEGTDDVRESPVVNLVEILCGKGHTVKIYDEELSLQQLVGKNRAFALNSIPHLSDLLTNDLQALVDASDIIVVHHGLTPQKWKAINLKDDLQIIDLTSIDALRDHRGYEGIYWE